ncbi:MAG: glucosamine inositolphosphorylceramide transferase family protein, partial [Candidatus Binataceae bacterium]
LAPRIAKRLIDRPFQGKRRHHWRICLRQSDSPRMLAGPSPQWTDSRWLPGKPDHFYADPFLLEHEGQMWLFYEDYDYRKHRGNISCAPIQADLSMGPSVTCLDLPYHVSYPLVFHHDGEIFMIPESARNMTVDLYRAAKFPFSWKLGRTLFRGAAVDTTPIFHQGRWYFFTTLCEPPGNAVFGALFSSDRIDGDWTFHPSSPISTDVHTARSAGAIQRVDGRIFRPVQDCSENYGRRIFIQEILQLTPDTCREQQLHSIEPNWEAGLKGVHTYGYASGIEVLDAVTMRFRRKTSP